ncbi:hypothetical protein PEDI_36400 [Persicobacter diffluens]|uniref:Uncharacterized protein n=1 Tax=Persicobacter diffluens TaxID=981 RepID=A0AAN5ANQ6_9BACT|nr:hypothetical protein PEDI_36400 [Persicobacter diffluens]
MEFGGGWFEGCWVRDFIFGGEGELAEKWVFNVEPFQGSVASGIDSMVFTHRYLVQSLRDIY